jgi:hypothetical protein
MTTSVAKYSAPSALSSNIITTELNSLANGSESALITYDNSTDKELYAAVTILLGSLAAVAGGSLNFHVYMSDGTNVADKSGGGDVYPMPILSGTSAKVIIIPMVRLYPFSLRFSVTNNAGVSFASSNNGIYLRTYSECIG